MLLGKLVRSICSDYLNFSHLRQLRAVLLPVFFLDVTLIPLNIMTNLLYILHRIKNMITFTKHSFLKNLIWPLLLVLTISNTQASINKAQIIDLLRKNRHLAPQKKAGLFSKAFLGIKTGNGPLGEGPSGKFDKDPLYRFDLFDCTTYVETVLALSVSNNFHEFKSNINEIRYEEGRISYLDRNHFISLDWIPNNTLNGILVDITRDLFEEKTETASAQIDKRSWYNKKGLADIQGHKGLSKLDKNELLLDLKRLGNHIRLERATIPYISLKNLFKNPTLLKRIPENSIISVVRPNWDLKNIIGTHLNVSHQGLAIRKSGKLYYRHATSGDDRRVSDMLFSKYFKRYLDSPTIKGINILEIQ